MKLTILQWLWVSAGALFAASVLLDVAGIVNVRPTYMLLCSTLLLISGWWLMPSMKEIRKAQRRRS